MGKTCITPIKDFEFNYYKLMAWERQLVKTHHLSPLDKPVGGLGKEKGALLGCHQSIPNSQKSKILSIDNANQNLLLIQGSKQGREDLILSFTTQHHIPTHSGLSVEVQTKAGDHFSMVQVAPLKA